MIHKCREWLSSNHLIGSFSLKGKSIFLGLGLFLFGLLLYIAIFHVFKGLFFSHGGIQIIVFVGVFIYIGICFGIVKFLEEGMLNIQLIVSLILAVISFSVEKFLLEDGMFAPFPIWTIVTLYIVFFALFLGIFYKKFPAPILIFLPSIYLIGIFISIPFVISLSGIMLYYAWILIPFGGIGLLAYSPLAAITSFTILILKISKELKDKARKLNHLFLTICFTLITVYSAYYFFTWAKIDSIFINESAAPIGFDLDLPKWFRISNKIPKNSITEFYLQPSGESRGTVYQFGSSRKLFHPFAFVADFLSKDPHVETDQELQDKVKILSSLYGYSLIELERLWSGDSIITKNISTHIQLYPESRIAYTAITLDFTNTGKRTEEAIYTILSPEGSIATKLSLWINGKEEASRLTLKSKAKLAYTTIVGVEKRDPALLEWLPGGKFRLKIFPVLGKETRTVRVGIQSFLGSEQSSLVYKGIHLEGIPNSNFNKKASIDLFSNQKFITLSSNDTILKEKLVSDNEVRQFETEISEKEDFNIVLKAKETIQTQGSFQSSSGVYSIEEAKFKTLNFEPETIYISLHKKYSKEIYIDLFKKIKNQFPNSKIYFIGETVFYSEDLAKINLFLSEYNYPNFQIFPFYILPKTGTNLILVSNDDSKLDMNSFKENSFYAKNEKFFEENKSKILIASLDSELNSFFKSYQELNRIQLIANSVSDFEKILDSREYSEPIEENSYYFKQPNYNISKINSTAFPISGNDKLPRLYLYKKLMKQLSSLQIDKDQNLTEHLKLAENGYFVSPISSLVVLESEADYKKFGIQKNKSELGESSLKNPGAVPEPEEWFFIIVALGLVLFFLRRNKKIKFEI